MGGRIASRVLLPSQTQLGAAVWIALAIASFLPLVHLGIIEVLLLLAVWVIVPMGADLLLSQTASKVRLLFPWFLIAAACLTTISFFISNRIYSSAFAASWLPVCIFFSMDGCLRLWTSRGESFSQFCFAVGEGSLLVAGLWLVASRAGMHPFGFQEPIVLLTAVHFHFAGFASAVIAGLTQERLKGERAAMLLLAACLAVVCGPGVLGLMFLVGPKAKLIAALLIAVGQCGLAWSIVQLARKLSGVGRACLLIAGGSVALGMILAAAWAIGEFPLQPFVDIRKMAEYHGVLNAVGFAACGLYGWWRIKTAEVILLAGTNQDLPAIASRRAP